MYTVQSHPCLFTHSLRRDRLPGRFQDFARDWARDLHPEERLQYYDGEFYIVLPFDRLVLDTITSDELSAFTRRFNRLHHVDDGDGLDAHVQSYPYKKWSAYGEEFDDYLEMMFMLHHIRANVGPDLAKPATLALFMHD